MEGILAVNKEVLSSLFLSPNSELREAAIEIFANMSTVPEIQSLIVEDFRFLARVIALLSSGTKNQRICELAAVFLMNLVKHPNGKKSLLHYERELSVLACTSVSLSSTMVKLLGELNSDS